MNKIVAIAGMQVISELLRIHCTIVISVIVIIMVVVALCDISIRTRQPATKARKRVAIRENRGDAREDGVHLVLHFFQNAHLVTGVEMYRIPCIRVLCPCISVRCRGCRCH